MNGMEKSDSAIVAMKSANKGVVVPAEPMEPRAEPKGNPRGQSTRRAQDRESVSQAAERIRQFVQREPQARLTTLLHHVTVDALRWAFFELKRNASAGVDGMTWTMYAERLEGRLADLHDRVHSGAYRATPSRRVNIPKPDGGTRPLGIAALEDKIVQKAVVETILTPIYEAQFLGFSYGFRLGRGAHDALDALVVGIERRKINWVVDCDIRAFFDAVSRDWLVRFLEHRIADKRVIRLIVKWLNAGVMEDGEWRDNLRGTPQGSVVSPLSNLVLDELDKELERRGLRFCRYADDCNIYVRSLRAGERVMASVSRFLTRKLRLTVNESKSAVDWANRRQFLGFRIIAGGRKRGLAPKAIQRFKRQVRVLTRRTRGISLTEMVAQVGDYLRGWYAYFGFCQTPWVLGSLDSWVRRRLRAYQWRQWRRGRRRFRELRRRSLTRYRAAIAAGSQLGPWRISDSHFDPEGHR